ncbi:MAG: hypothetical protein JWM27_3107 [Gemmatimonadetes bacterium]|nr:hypothetical protein [Gemmatimonadota bacterium]
MTGRILRRAGLVAFAALALAARDAAAVNVSPAVLYIDGHTREGVVTLYNSGTQAEEIEVGFQWGTHVSDDVGVVRLVLADSAPEGAPSALSWLRAYPRRLVLAPGESQVVRVIVRPPAGLAAGEYWARMVVNAVPQVPAVENTNGQATMQLRIGTRIVGGLHYRVGRLSTSLSVEHATAERDGKDVHLTLDLVRGGNAAFIGRLRARLLDAHGAVVGEEHVEPITVYRSLRWRFTLPAADASRVAAVEYTFDTERPDLPPGTALDADPIQGRVNLTEGATNVARSR